MTPRQPACARCTPQFCQTKGFPIAKREAIRPATANTATKQDLVISAYKPTAAFEQRFHSQAGHEQLPELRAILKESFLQDEAGRWYVPDPGRAQDLERLREWRTYVEGRGRLKVFRSERSEAVRAGFGDAWRRCDYDVIVATAQRLAERVVQEDADLLMV